MFATRRRPGPADADGRSPPVRSEPLAEALDRLLEPLDSLPSRVGSAAETHEFDLRSPKDKAVEGGRMTDALLMFPRRLHRSSRLRYRVLRLVIAWTSLGVAVFGVVWLTFALVGQH